MTKYYFGYCERNEWNASKRKLTSTVDDDDGGDEDTIVDLTVEATMLMIQLQFQVPELFLEGTKLPSSFKSDSL